MQLYGILDKNDDEQVTVETIVRALMVDMHKNSGETSVSVVKLPLWQCPSSAPAPRSSARAWRLRAARHSKE